MKIKIRDIDSILLEQADDISFDLKDVPLTVQESFATYLALEDLEKALDLANSYCFLDQKIRINNWRKNGKRIFKKSRRKNRIR